MEETQPSTFGELLKAFRKQQHITQHELAMRIGAHRNTIGAWERGNFLPESKTIVLELAYHLHLDTQETRRLLEASMTALSPYWQMLYQRNPFFTGREEVLQQLHDALAHERTAILSQSYALSGLGGIGKTQTAIEYAYRYSNDYTAIFWISAETTENVISSMIAIATLLNLPEKQEQDQEKVVAAVTRWLINHRDWLLIFDNVEDPALIKRFLPPARRGSLLFTSRRQSLRFTAQSLDLERMTLEEGMRFLVHRARLLDPTASLDQLAPEDLALAREIVAEMDGLPLALDQAGAYIEATRCSLSDYLRLFRSSHFRLLDERDAHMDHPLSVARTFVLSFEQIEQSNILAADLLTACAFLAPEAIPETFFLEGATYLGPTFEALNSDPFAFHDAIKLLLSYSLLQRNTATHMVTIHRLVQVILKERLSEAVQRMWTARVIHAMSQLFPAEDLQANYRKICERLIPHALVCLTLSNQWSENAALRVTLMSHMAEYLAGHTRFAEAESLYSQALSIGEHTLGMEHLLVAEVLRGLANRFMEQGKYEQVESLYLQVLSIRKHALGTDHLLVAEVLHELANYYFAQGKYEQAESLDSQALCIRKHALGTDHPLVAKSLNSMAVFSALQGKYELAETLFQQAMHIWVQALGPEHFQTVFAFLNLGELYREQGKYEQAEPLLQRVLSIWEQALGLEHPNLANPLHGLGELYREQGKYEQAEPLLQRAWRIWEQALGANCPQIAFALYGLGELYKEQGKYEQAEALYHRALWIREQALGSEHVLLAEPLTGLGDLYTEQDKYKEAELLYQRALALRQQHLSPQHPKVAECLHHLARFHQKQRHTIQALSLYQQSLEILEQVFGTDHPKTRKLCSEYFSLLGETVGTG